MAASSSDSRTASLERLRELLKGMRTAMLTTVGEDGVLHSRPMVAHTLEEEGELWFFTYADSVKVKDVEHDREVNLAFTDTDRNRWISVAGRARLIRDKQQMTNRWRPLLRAWFPRGLEDPALALLRVEVTSAQYWDQRSSRMVQFVGLARALVTGRPAELFKVGYLDFAQQPGA